MPVTAFLHTHVLVVILFLLLFTIKAALLLLNKRTALTSLRNKTKVVEMILGTLILVTGGWMLFNYSSVPGWLITKVVFVLIAIPVGIVGLKRENKILTVLALLLFVYVYGIAETDSLAMHQEAPENTTVVTTPETAVTKTSTPEVEAASFKESETTPAAIVATLNKTALTNAQTIFVQQCATCHGEDGTKGLGGAADLTISQLNLNDRKQIIAEGRDMMPPYREQLSEQELEELAAYTMTFKK